MSKIRRLLAAGFAGAIVMSGAVVLSPGSSGAGVTTVSPDTNADDGSPGTLREILENLPDGNQVVELPAGSGPYVLTCEEGGQISVNDSVEIIGNGNTIQQSCNDRVISTEYNLTVEGVTIRDGAAECEGGGIYNGSDMATLTIVASTITENVAYCGDGGGVYSLGPLVIIDSTFTRNTTSDDGAAFSNGDEEFESPVTVIRSTIAANCAEDDGAIDVDGDLTIVNSTVTDNTFDDQGAIASDAGRMTLVYSDVVSNTLEDDVNCPGLVMDVGAEDPDGEVDTADTGEASNLTVESGDLEIFGSVIALPIDVNEGSPGAFNCNLGAEPNTTSEGYNYSDDDTCGLTDPTDTENGADPQLGALAPNGGPTWTRLPAPTSPLVDAIPTAACGAGDALAGEAITTDQRGLVRPDVVSQLCDIGAVEIQTEAPVELEPNFTG